MHIFPKAFEIPLICILDYSGELDMLGNAKYLFLQHIYVRRADCAVISELNAGADEKRVYLLSILHPNLILIAFQTKFKCDLL